MPKKRRQAKIPTPAWERSHGAIGQRLLGRSPRFYATAAIVALIVVTLGLLGFAYLSDYRADQRRPGSTALQVDDIKYSLRYFTERLEMFVQQSGGPANDSAQPTIAIPAVAEQLQREAAMLNFAAELGVVASEDDIQAEIAIRLGLEPDSANFDDRFQEELQRGGLTETEYRAMVEAAVLARKLLDHFQADLPVTAESIKYRQIVVASQDAADEIVRELEDGADFEQLAVARSLDTTTAGETIWAPRGVAEPALEESLFGLPPGEFTTYPTQSGVFVFQVVDRVSERAIEPGQRPNLAQRSLEEWLASKREGLEVVNEMDLSSGDGEKIRWAVNQVYRA